MLFNSFAFALFLPTVFILYWLIPPDRLRAQNAFLLLVSYIFYGWWDWRFLSLLFASSLLDFLVGLGLQRTDHPTGRKALLACSLLGNLGMLGFFKYYNFFVDSFVRMLHGFGLEASPSTLNIILPAGISFYTFQTLSYGLDVYRRHMQATTDPIAFFAFVSFFPQLVAGPIERAVDLVPQFARVRTFDWDRARDGMRQILWGLFKKIVIADNLGRSVDAIYRHYADLDGIELGLGTVYFAFQIYCDFSGYSDIAIGSARLFGFELTRNFINPYFSRDIAEFWRRWHITLSTWFRDYLYLPLGGNRTGRLRWLRNILLTFTVSGFWHGANWNFIVWGFLHGLYYVPLIFTKSHRRHIDTVAAGRVLPTVREGLQVATTFCLVLVAWIFFRAASLDEALRFIGHMCTHAWLVYPEYKSGAIYVAVLVTIEWLQRSQPHALAIAQWPRRVRWAVYYVLIAGMFWYGYTEYSPFIYFQF
jgi:D-alanyl-lipoteichoic acid acyltransferase DltB (MBOAT superfamily)